jgi:hypothetical protein
MIDWVGVAQTARRFARSLPTLTFCLDAKSYKKIKAAWPFAENLQAFQN